MTLLTQLPEDFLQHIWNSCNFELKGLKTLGGEPIFIRQPGTWNHDQGPDFRDARLSIDGMEWHGQVEIHVQSQDWYRHGHHLDKAFNNTILHVVMRSSGKQIFREDGTSIPELEMKDRISPGLMNRYQQLQLAESKIPCQSQLKHLDAALLEKNLRRTAWERMEAKALDMKKRLKLKTQDWEQVLWEELLSMMGGTVNRSVFRDLAQRLPLKKIRKQLSEIMDVEALLYGTAGMLLTSSQADSYFLELRERWEFLRHKLKIEMAYPLDIRYMRMRPAAFPEIRLSQSAALLQQFPLLVNLLNKEGSERFLKLSIQASSYWDTHYRFFENSKAKVKKLGNAQKQLLISNCLLPIAILYKRAHGDSHIESYIMSSLEQLKAEKNRITRIYKELGWPHKHGLHSQGMIQLHKRYCNERRCLHCEIGKEILA